VILVVTMDLAAILKNAQHPSILSQIFLFCSDYFIGLEIRSQAESFLAQAVDNQYVYFSCIPVFVCCFLFQGPFLLALCTELATEGKDVTNRQLAGLYIKNMISAQVVFVHRFVPCFLLF
jgi:hypothetical protein